MCWLFTDIMEVLFLEVNSTKSRERRKSELSIQIYPIAEDCVYEGIRKEKGMVLWKREDKLLGFIGLFE